MKLDRVGTDREALRDLEDEIKETRKETMSEVQSSVSNMAYVLKSSQDTNNKHMYDAMKTFDDRLKTYILLSQQQQDELKATTERHLIQIQENSSRKLDEMRQTVDEKLQETLDKRLSSSFNIVSERLEQVYKGLGEMQTLADGVGDLKKVLSNVKTRGIIGEIQLGAILDQVLSKDQYLTNVITKHGSGERVEYAVKIPLSDSTTALLPIDAKFPLDAYTQLQNAIDSGSGSDIQAARKTLDQRIKVFARDIFIKYIDPPYTTDFAILFLPTEGLYAEVVREGLIEELHSRFRVVIAGPSTMTALLNSLQMGFKAMTIQQRTNEVWKVLTAVKTEFSKFEETLTKTQKRLDEANRELDDLVGKRTRAIQRKLDGISQYQQNYIDITEDNENSSFDQ
ncbi:MAG: DNA recombination protein RmuC [Oscillospiraceae bacterium]|nr:DNA recombination protein RmuC [Oscillospiraceae bacterium]